MLDLLFVSVHVPAGLVAVIAGVIAMLSRKGRWWHRRAGLAYLLGIVALTLSARGLVFTRGPEFIPIFALGVVATLLAMAGYLLKKRRQDIHIAGLGLSYIVMLTAFYVDNGPKLPFWDQFPGLTFWVGPAVIGLPIILRALWRRGYGRMA